VFIKGNKLRFVGDGSGRNCTSIIVYHDREQVEVDVTRQTCTVIDGGGTSGAAQVLFDFSDKPITVAKDEVDFTLASGNRWLVASESVVQLERAPADLAKSWAKMLKTPDRELALLLLRVGSHAHAMLAVSRNTGPGMEDIAVWISVQVTERHNQQFWLRPDQALQYVLALSQDEHAAAAFREVCREKGYEVHGASGQSGEACGEGQCPSLLRPTPEERLEDFLTQWRLCADSEAKPMQFLAVVRAAREGLLPSRDGLTPTFDEFLATPAEKLLALKGIGPKTVELLQAIREKRQRARNG
jgi:hypothetical protein